jgi:hypothetical protein
LQVVTTVIIAVPIFAALGVALVLGGRTLGVLEAPPAPTLASRIEIANAPTEAPAPLADASTPVAAALTVDPGCAQAQSWWDGQRENYQYFVERFGSRYTLLAGADIQPALDEMQQRLAQVRAASVPPCLETARQGLADGMTQIVTAYTLLRDVTDPAPATLQSYRDNASRAFSGAFVSLWEAWDVATDPSAPSVLNIPRGGGEGCAVSPWYAVVREQIAGFNTIIEAADPRTLSGGRLRQDVDNLLAIRDSVAAAETPPCANTARDTIVAMMNSYIDGYEAIGNANNAASASAFARASALSYSLHAWLTWLGAVT